MIETPSATRRSSRRQSSYPLDASDPDNDSNSNSATETSTRSRTVRRRGGKFAEDLDDYDAAPVKHAANGRTSAPAAASPAAAPNALSQRKTTVTEGVSSDPNIIDGWRPGQDPKVDYSGEFEFGGPLGTAFLMIFFPVLMWYMWIGATEYDGKLPTPAPGQTWSQFGAHLVQLVYTGAFPHAKAWLWYWSYLIFQGACYCLLPGVWGWGKPLAHQDGKQLKYYCNAYFCLYFTFAILGALHYTGVWKLYNAIDEFGPLLSVAILSGFLVSIVAYASALYRGKQHRMTGNIIYDFFMGAELNPRMFGILDFKMFFEVRMPWYFLLILSLGTAARQWERYGYVSGEVMFLVMAHYLYANACAKGEELIITTW